MVRLATIGTNFITEYLLSAGKFCQGFRLEAVCSRSEQKAKAFAQKWGARRYFTNIDDLAACPDIDAVYIATPNFTHCAYAMKMLCAGKHVLVEKSGAANEREFQQMVDFAKKRGLVVLEAIRIAFNPDLELIRQSLGKLGKIRRAIFTCGAYSSRYDNFKRGIIENAFRPEMCNGALMDLGVYAVNIMVDLFGAPQKVNADAIRLENGLDGVLTATCTYPGMLATVFTSKVADSSGLSEIQGEEGLMRIESCSTPSSATITYNTRRSGQEKSEVLPLLAAPFGEDMKYELQVFLDLIAAGGEGMDRYNNRTLCSLRVMDEIRAQCGMVFPNDKV